MLIIIDIGKVSTKEIVDELFKRGYHAELFDKDSKEKFSAFYSFADKVEYKEYSRREEHEEDKSFIVLSSEAAKKFKEYNKRAVAVYVRQSDREQMMRLLEAGLSTEEANNELSVKRDVIENIEYDFSVNYNDVDLLVDEIIRKYRLYTCKRAETRRIPIGSMQRDENDRTEIMGETIEFKQCCIYMECDKCKNYYLPKE